MTNYNFSCFKALDIRGKIGEELSDELVYNIGRAAAVFLKAKKVVLGSDVRLSSPSFKQQLAKGLQEMGVDVIDVGTVGTEVIYFATNYLNTDGGIEVTASHNPKDYNGLKIVGKYGVPLSIETGLQDIIDIIKQNDFKPAETKGAYTELDISEAYVDKLLSFVNLDNLKGGSKLKLLLNPGNGTAGPALKQIEERLVKANANLEFEYLFLEPDGNFPNGIPNPLLVENRKVTSEKVLELGADLGIAFDGDFDRCFFFDNQGNFIDGYYLCGLLSQSFASKNPGCRIVYEPRLVWNTKEIIESNGATPVLSKTGHSFIKAKLREVDAIYGGEMSAHHYFRDYYFCDSGMVPWLLVVELLKTSGKSISDLINGMKTKYPCSDEMNFKVADADVCIAAVHAKYAPLAKQTIDIDGYSYEFDDWRFNVRRSNTEPLLRLNVESKANRDLVNEKVKEISEIITKA